MANEYKGEIKGKLGDKERTFRLTFESICNIEDLLKQSIMKTAQQLATNDFTFKSVVTILHEGLKGSGNKITFETVGDMVSQGALVECAILSGQLLGTIFINQNEEETKKEEESSPLEIAKTK
tara:strand:- start:1409 stop:1777 length:369 start_codon:yes stop_codon:yes gene_type:complete